MSRFTALFVPGWVHDTVIVGIEDR